MTDEMYTRIMYDLARLRWDLERAIEAVNTNSSIAPELKIVTQYAYDLVILRIKMIEATYPLESAGR